jgi:hypothetical protein
MELTVRVLTRTRPRSQILNSILIVVAVIAVRSATYDLPGVITIATGMSLAGAKAARTAAQRHAPAD